VDLNSTVLVQDPATQSIGPSQAVHEWPKAHPLHHTAHTDATRGHLRVFRVYDTAAALPSDLNHFAVFHKNGNSSLSSCESLHSLQSIAICFDVEFDKITPLPFQPIPEFLCEWATCGSKKLTGLHGV
jgi:hypothetical protein